MTLLKYIYEYLNVLFCIHYFKPFYKIKIFRGKSFESLGGNQKKKELLFCSSLSTFVYQTSTQVY